MSDNKTPQILLDSKLNQLATKPTTYSPEVPFQEFFDDALTTKESMIKPTVPQKSPVVAMNNTMDPLTLSKNGAVLAQAVNSTPVNRENNRKKISTDNKSKSLDNAEKKVTHTPFQLFIDQAIEVLDRISQQESYVNNLTEDYISGKVSIDEVSIEATKLNMAITFITTVITTASTTLKELTGMQI